MRSKREVAAGEGRYFFGLVHVGYRVILVR
jgi:hypothetical protein